MSILVEVFTAPGCSQCGRAKDVLRKIVEAWADNRLEWREVNLLEEIDYAVQLGVLATPAIAVGGKLVFTALPSEKKLHQLLQQQLEASDR